MVELAIEPRSSKVDKARSHKEQEMAPQEKEIRGVWEAIQFVDKLAKNKHKQISEQVVRQIHKRVMSHFHPEVAGYYRDYEVGIKRAIFLPPHWSEVKPLMWQFGKDLEAATDTLSPSLPRIENVLKVAAVVHYEFVRIHPFQDGNGRTARLLTDLIFKRASLYYITDWGSRNEEYITVLRRVDETGNLRHLIRFLAAKLAKRFEVVEAKLNHGSVRRIAKQSALLVDLANRKAELLRISQQPVVNPKIKI